MIKYALQSITSYVMSIFLLPNSLVDEIEKFMNAFSWGHARENRKGMHWMSQEKLSLHKNHGGMGFTDLTTFNIPMLGKQDQKFLTESNNLVSRVFITQYFLTVSYLDSKIGRSPSFVWQSIFSVKIVVKR